MASSHRNNLKSGHQSRATQRQKQNLRLEATVSQVIARHAPELAAGQPRAGLDSATLASIVSEICGAGLDADRKATRILDRVLRAMQRVTQGEVCLPDPVVCLPRKASPFRPQEMARVRGLSEAIAAFTSDLTKMCESDRDLPAARILFSAIVFGGLLHRTLINAFPKALHEGFAAANGICWIDIPLKSEEAEDKVRRWFPDPITQCLIARWRNDGCTWPAQRTPDALISSLLKHLGQISGKRFDKSLGALVRAAVVRTRLLIPGILVDFLQSVEHGQSLPAYAWWRVFADHHLEKPKPSVSEAEEEIASEIDATNQPDVARSPHRQDSSEDLEAVKLLMASLKKNNGAFRGVAEAKRSIQDLRKRLGERGPLFTALMDWSEWRLRPSTRAVSVHRYLSSFAKALIAAGGEVDPEKVAPAVLESVYRDVVVSMTTNGKRNDASARLRDFHVFLMINREVASVEIEGEVTSLRSVRANIISEAEYGRALAEIDRMSDERMRAMLRVMLIIAFRTGVRRSELTHARIADLQAGLEYDSTRPLLWIHAHPDASLKTYASLRRLPLAHLLTREERAELIEWVGRRLRETSLDRPAQSLLFCEQGANTAPVADERLDFLVELLRAVCEDDTIVFHTLRHCFLSHLFSRVFVAEIQFRYSQSITCPWSRSEKDWKSLKMLFRSELLPREGAYLLSALAGHIDPMETMISYIHLQDWVAGLYFRELASTHGVALWAALEGISPEAMMVRHSREKRRTGVAVVPHIDTPQRMLKSLHIPKPPGHPPKPPSALPIASPPAPVERLRQMRLEGVYSALAIASKPMNEGARRLLTGIDSALYRRLCQKASELAATQSATRNEEARRSRILAPKAKRRQPLPSRLPQIAGLGPSIPRQHRERSDAREAFRSAMESKDQKIVDNLEFLLKSTSHSDPILRLHSLSEVNRCVALLSSLGIAGRRLALEIKSVPRSLDDPKKWPKIISKRTRFSRRELINSEDPEALPRAIKRHKEGVLALHIYSDAAHKNGSKKATSSLAYGWRVGCFYALCVLRTLAADEAAASARKPSKVPATAKR